MNGLPEIRIKYGWHLDGVFQSLLDCIGKLKKEDYPTADQTRDVIASYVEAWQPYEQKILKGMCNLLELDFYLKTIDVYVVGRGRSFSNPLTVSSHYPPDKFIDVLTHELLHRLFTDNVQKVSLKKLTAEMFSNEELSTKNHVFVFAAQKAIYLDVLNEPNRFERDLTNIQDPNYKRAWNIVETEGYIELLSNFKDAY